MRVLLSLTMFRAKLVLVFLLLLLQSSANANPFVIETDGVASSYAASIMYDDATDRLYITGSTYGGTRSFFHVDGQIQDTQQRIANEFVVEPPTDSTTTTTEDEELLSDCFIGILQVPRGDRAPEWVRRVAIGEPDQSESCADLFTYRQGNNRKLVLVGHVIGGGSSVLKEQQTYFSSSSASSSAGSNATVSGMVLDLTWYAEVQGGYLMNENAVQYPVAVIADERQTTGEDIYVATLRSSWSAANPAFQLYQENDVNNEHAEELDLTTSGGYLPPAYGDKFALLLQRLGRRSSTESEILTIASENAVDRTSSNEMPNSASLLAMKAAAGMVDTSSLQAQSYDQYRYVEEPLAERWRREFDGDDTSIQVSSLLHLKGNSTSNVIIVAGSSRGSVAGLGEGEDDSMTGFIAAIDSSLGITLRTRRLSSSSTTSDHILGLCQDANRNLYAVGMTTGGLSKGQAFVGTESQTTFAAFLQKLHPDTLKAIWTKSLVAATAASQPGSIHGMSCAVTPDGSNVYLAGTVKAGAAITLDGKTLATTSAGNDDIFVAQYKSNDGTLNFVRQIGTKENDQLAAGKGAVCDKYGNLIVIANTRGSFLKPDEKINPDINDVAILSVNRISGDHADLVSGENQPRNIPTATKNAAGSESSSSPHKATANFFWLLQQRMLDFFSKDAQFPALVGIFAVSAIIALGALLVFLCRRRRNSNVAKAQVQKEIEDFDPEFATSSEKNSADDDCSSCYCHDTSTSFCDEDALMPLSTPADRADNIGYKASLRRLEQLDEQQETPLKRHRGKRPRPLLPKIEKPKVTQSIVRNQENEEQSECLLKGGQLT